MHPSSHRTLFGRLVPVAAAVFILLVVLCSGVGATEEYARLTGKACGACHLDPAGGGELTPAGRAFQHSRAVPGDAARAALPGSGGTLRHLIHFAAGYIHLLGAIFWFGTILYVHMVLKPSYASHGLPKGEVRVGLVSMAVMALTGAVLTAYRIPAPAAFFASRFGILLAVKIGLFLIMAGSALVVVLVIGPRLRKSGRGAGVPAGDLTGDQLVACDGTDGRPAYIAYRGDIYDVSASRLWKNGVHAGRHHAGGDLTDMLGQAPHGAEKVLAMPRVGHLLEAGGTPGRPLHEKVFFFMAYMNLTMVFLIVLIVAIWRWW